MTSSSHARRFSFKEMAILLLPCLLLTAFALAMRSRGSNTIDLNQRFALTMEKYEFEPITAYEVSQGYSAKLKVTLNHVGPTPKWWGNESPNVGNNNSAELVSGAQGGKLRAISLSPDETEIMLWQPQYDAATNRYIARYMIPLARVAPQTSDVILKSEIFIQNNNRKKLCAPLPLQIVLRKAGEAIEVPRVSTESRLAVKRVEIIELSPAARQLEGLDTEVHVLLRYTGAIDAKDETVSKIALGPIKITNAQGDQSGLTAMEFRGFYDPNNPDAPYTKTMVMRISLLAFPQKLGALWYETEYSYDNGWPLRVRIPLRAANSKRLFTIRRGEKSFLKVVKTAVLPADEFARQQGCDTTVTIDAEYSGPVPESESKINSERGKMPFVCDWSQHLIDEKGKAYWSFKSPEGVGGMSVGSGGGTFSGNDYAAQYSFPLSQIPSSAGRVWLKAEIAVGNNAFLPVSVLVRDTPLSKL